MTASPLFDKADKKHFHAAHTSYSSFQHSPSSMGTAPARLLLCLCKQAAWEEMYVIQLRQDCPRAVRNQQRLYLSSFIPEDANTVGARKWQT